MRTGLKNLAAFWRYRSCSGKCAFGAENSMAAALHWLCSAQDAVGGEAISRAYSLRSGWELPYPETTGYIIPTFLALDERFPALALRQRAWRAGLWLVQVQFDSGAICSKQHRPGNTQPSVFNTGMVLHGWVSLLEQNDDERVRLAAHKAAAWLAREQETDGSWVRNAFNGIPHTYYTMVDWALLRHARLAGDDRARAAAARHLEWTLRQQRANGWFDHCWFNVGEPVTTHTISYTTQGLVESGRLLREPRHIQAAFGGTVPLRHCFETSGKLPGTFDELWRPTADWECCTGNAQTSLVWQALGAALDDISWRQSAEKLNQHLLRCQKVGCSAPGINGAIPGSWPLGGGYDPFNFPNHAAKFHVDALASPPPRS